MLPPAVVTSTCLRLNLILPAGERSKSSAPRSTAASASPSAARYGSRVAPSRVRIAAMALTADSAAIARALMTGASSPASRRTFRSFFSRASCSGVDATSSEPCCSKLQRRSRRRTSAMKSSDARRHACQPLRAARRPIAVSTSWKLTPGSSEIHPDANPLLPRPTCAPSTTTTFIPAAENAYAAAHPVSPPPMTTTSVVTAPCCLENDGTRDFGQWSIQGDLLYLVIVDGRLADRRLTGTINRQLPNHQIDNGASASTLSAEQRPLPCRPPPVSAHSPGGRDDPMARDGER